MGDRANVYMLEEDKPGEKVGVFLYSHWSGSELPQIVQRALARRQRWDDSQYLARIIFCEMVRGSEAEETGFGISARIGDNEYQILVVDAKSQRVSFCDSQRFHALPVKDSQTAAWSFEEYVRIAASDLQTAWCGGG
jgi:hypothetical protein